MSKVDYDALIEAVKGRTIERPNKSTAGTLSGHAAGDPFEKLVYKELKERYPNNIFKQYEFLNDLYLRNPEHKTIEDRESLFYSLVVLFLLSRGDRATREWNPANMFKEKQNDTADILFHLNGFFELIDVKTRNISKHAMPPNIISAYKVALMCKNMLNNHDFDSVELNYVEIDWVEDDDKLRCTDVHSGHLFKANPATLYINWTAAMQIQFHVCDLDQSFTGSIKEWAIEYLKVFVNSAEKRCEKMVEQYIKPFLTYIR